MRLFERPQALIGASAFVLVASQSWAKGDCAALIDAAPEGVTIQEATQTAADEDIETSHCLVRGTMDERTGSDGKPYALRFELRLPDDWLGRFMHQFNGGTDGELDPAVGAGTGVSSGEPALERGFAVLSSDAGHDGDANPEAGLAGSNRFGFDFEARKDYGYDAVPTVHPVGLALTETYYGRAPDYVYGYGTSNGGRHALVQAERMPDAFDGLLAGYPGFNLPKAAVQSAWDAQTFASIGPSLAEAFSRAELTLVSDAIVAACDALDGLEDGVVFDVTGCQAAFDPSSLVCQSDSNDCLPAEKVAGLQRVHAGPTDSAGNPLYNRWYWDTGIDSGNWRFWKLESTVPAWNNKPIIAVMGSSSLAQTFTTPPTPVDGDPASLERYLIDFDFDEDAPKIFATSADYPESPMEVMTPPNADEPTLDEFEQSASKLIVFHGVSDPIFSFKDTADWYGRLTRNNETADKFVRFYAIPGMPHGQGGNAPDEVDLLGALIKWVENDTAPRAVTARFRDDGKEIAPDNAGAERPLCPWPTHAEFTGNDRRKADSFSCSE